MSLSPQWLDELRARTTLSTLIGRTVRVQKAGREYKACCPFHNEKSPSFTVNDEKGFYHCFGCGAHGDAIRWMTENRGLGFMDAIKELAADAGMTVPAPDPRAARQAEKRASLHDVMAAAQDFYVAQLNNAGGAEARAYLDRRGISAATVRAFGFGFAPDSKSALKKALAHFGDAMLVEAGLLIAVEDKEPYDRFRGRLMIPIRDARGRVIAFGGRILGTGEPKYLNSPDTPLFDKGRTLYNLDKALPASRQSGRMIVVEGYMDAIALSQAGFADVVAPLGTAITETQIEMLWKSVERPLLCLDGDAAGQRAAMRAAMRALPLLRPGHSLDFVALPQGQDPDDLLRDAGPPAMASLLGQAVPLVEQLWRHEQAAAPLATPEERAGLRARLRAHCDLIQHPDIRAHYRDAFDERIADLFARRRPERDGAPFGAGGRGGGGRGGGQRGRTGGQRPGWATPPVTDDVRQFASSHADDMLARAVIDGLMRYPDVIAAQFDRLAAYQPADPECAALLSALLALPLGDGPQGKTGLDTGGHLTILGDTDLYNKAGFRLPAGSLSFTFNRDSSVNGAVNGDDAAGQDKPEMAGGLAYHARKDLVEAIRVMVERPLIESALARANRRAETELDEDSYAEQQRLRLVKDEFDRRLADLMQPDEF